HAAGFARPGGAAGDRARGDDHRGQGARNDLCGTAGSRMIYAVTYEVMPGNIDLIIERTITVDVDPKGDALTQINREVNRLEAKAKVVLYFVDEDEDLTSIADWCC